MAEQNENVKDTQQEEAKADVKYTDADVDSIVSKKFAEWTKKTEKAVADAVAKVEEAHKLSQMNEKEKADHERKQMEDELARYKAMETHNAMMTEARNMLKADNLTISDDILNVLVTDNAETTKAAVQAFSAAFQTAVNEAVKKQLAGGEPKRGATATGMTKEQIMAEKDTNKRLKLIEDNMHLFEDNFNGGKK